MQGDKPSCCCCLLVCVCVFLSSFDCDFDLTAFKTTCIIYFCLMWNMIVCVCVFVFLGGGAELYCFSVIIFLELINLLKEGFSLLSRQLLDFP